jgi:thiosulfate/3-mercaptopyruvate sulfurtransferase
MQEMADASPVGNAQSHITDMHRKMSRTGQTGGLLDARSAGRFAGTAPDPRPNLPSGHVPGSLSTPFPEVMDGECGRLRSPADLAHYFGTEKGLARGQPVVTMCGSGVTAAIVHVALLHAGWAPEQLRLYDGSWSEYAVRQGPIAQGAPGQGRVV